jgi:hypothetical protein
MSEMSDSQRLLPYTKCGRVTRVLSWAKRSRKPLAHVQRAISAQIHGHGQQLSCSWGLVRTGSYGA